MKEEQREVWNEEIRLSEQESKRLDQAVKRCERKAGYHMSLWSAHVPWVWPQRRAHGHRVC